MYKVPPFKAKALFIPNEMFYTEPLDHFFSLMSPQKAVDRLDNTTGYSCTSVGDVMELNYKTVCCTEIRE